MGDHQREQVDKILTMIFELTDEHLLARIGKTAMSRSRSLAQKRIEARERDVWDKLPVLAEGNVIYLVRRPRKGARLAALRDRPLTIVYVDQRHREIVVYSPGDRKTHVLTALDCERYGITLEPTPGALAKVLGG